MKSLKSKIIVPTVFIVTILVVAMTSFSLFYFSKNSGSLLQEKITSTANTLQKHLTDCENYSRLAALSASEDTDIVTAIGERDALKLDELLTAMIDIHFVDFFVVTDEDGTVLIRTYSPERGDSISHKKNVREALNGNVYTSAEEDADIKVSVRTGSPVFDSNGNFIGVVVAGVRLDSNEAVDNFKKQFNAESTVFFGDTRIATTIVRDGKRIVGTQLDPDVAEVVIADGKEYFGNADILGEEYSTFYMPLKDSEGHVFAILFVGQSNADLIAERNTLLLDGLLIGVLGLIISILMLNFIVHRIAKPINNVVHLVSEVTLGNIDVEIDRANITKDEIGKLTVDIFSLIDVIKATMADLANLTKGLNIYGSTDHTIDTSKYSGSYKEIIEGIKSLYDSISIMKRVMAAMDDLDVMICVTDFSYKLLYINQSYADKFGVDREGCLGQTCYKVINRSGRPCPSCQLQKIKKNMDSTRVLSFHDVWNDYANLWMGGRSAAISWVDGSTVYMHSFYDETEKKTYELHLDKALKEAEAASIAKSSFLANMSHEIRTPMNSIIGFSELALDDDISLKTRDYLKNIIGSAEGLLQIINDILDISKIESGNMELENIPFDIYELLAMCESINTPRAIEKGIELQFFADTAIDKMLIGDSTRLRQVLLNLLSNAVKFTDTGKVSLQVEVKDYSEKAATLRFEVRDSGIGMTPEQINTIAEPFTQADISTTRKYGGTGLGLSISKNILEMMSSKLEVESTPGIGSAFSFTLTMDTADETIEANSANDKLEKPMFKGDVLVCEDNKMNQLVITEHLEKVGLRAHIAGNGQEGIDIVQARVGRGEKPFDLIFMDIHMPVMDGIKAAPKIIKLGTGAPVVALTANIMAGDRELYKKLGMNDFVGKPFTSQELWRVLLKYIEPVGFEEKEHENDSLLIQLKTEFAKSNQTRFAEITEAIDSGDIELAHRQAHNLKSTAGLIGRSVLQKAAADVELALKNGEIPVEAGLMSLLEAELENALEDLKSFLNTENNPLPTQAQAGLIDGEKARELFDKLEPLLKSGNTECLNTINDLRAIPGCEKLIGQMEAFYFSEALETLAELRKNL